MPRAEPLAKSCEPTGKTRPPSRRLRRARQPRDRPHRAQPRPALEPREVSKAAGFSPFHFHRMFKGLIGETLKQFVKRQRLERALYMMSHAPRRSLDGHRAWTAASPRRPTSRAASSSASARRRAPSTSTSFRNSRREEFERVHVESSGGHVSRAARRRRTRTDSRCSCATCPRARWPTSACSIPSARASREPPVNASWRGRTSAGSRTASGSATCGRSPRSSRSRIAATTSRSWSPTSSPRARSAASSSRRCAWPRCVSGGLELEARAIDWLYKTWLPRSGFVPDDQPAFESWIGRPFAHGYEHFEIACQLPVKPA